MFSSILRSERAIQMNVAIMRAFVKLREILSTHKELAQKLDALEKRIGQHDEQIQAIFEAIRRLKQPTLKLKHQIACPPLVEFPRGRSQSSVPHKEKSKFLQLNLSRNLRMLKTT